MSPAGDRRRVVAFAGAAAGLVGLLLLPWLLASGPAGGEETPQAVSNPFRGQREAIEEGERIYRGRCYGCHFRAGGRGPNLFQTKLTDAEFFTAVTEGRPNGMPAWGSLLSTEEIWKVHAFVMSRDRL